MDAVLSSQITVCAFLHTTMETIGNGPAWLAVVVAMLGIYIAWRQWQTAREKLKIDLFELRLPVYEQTRDIIIRQHALGNALPPEEIFNFKINARVSRWIFDAKIADYIENEIVVNLDKSQVLGLALQDADDDAKREKIRGERGVLSNWLDFQITHVIDKKFGKYLKMKN